MSSERVRETVQEWHEQEPRSLETALVTLALGIGYGVFAKPGSILATAPWPVLAVTAAVLVVLRVKMHIIAHGLRDLDLATEDRQGPDRPSAALRFWFVVFGQLYLYSSYIACLAVGVPTALGVSILLFAASSLALDILYLKDWPRMYRVLRRRHVPIRRPLKKVMRSWCLVNALVILVTAGYLVALHHGFGSVVTLGLAYAATLFGLAVLVEIPLNWHGFYAHPESGL